jgi:hypothetical protein
MPKRLPGSNTRMIKTARTLPSRTVFNDLGVLILLALARLLVHTLTNGQYGFHRDELATLDDARYLAWGYVAYPPLTPFIAHLARELFGALLVGVRFFSALAQSLAMVLAGLVAHELGGSRRAQVDALDEQAVEEHIAYVARKTGRIDILFNAIGMQNVQGKPLIEMSLEDFTRPINITTRTQFLTARVVARRMVRQGAGVILTITAGPARRAVPNVGGFDRRRSRSIS